MKQEWVITIGREFCSGGAEIAHRLSEVLEIPYYDKNIIDHTAELLDLSTDVVREHDEKPAHFWDVSGYQYSNLWYSDDPSLLLPLSYRIADAQFKLIRAAATKGPCVIVGRCADYALKDRTNVLDVFIRAELQARIGRAVRLYDIEESEAKKLIQKTDKIRKNYYENYTHRGWGDSSHYEMVLDSGRLGTEVIVQMIQNFVENTSPSVQPL